MFTTGNIPVGSCRIFLAPRLMFAVHLHSYLDRYHTVIHSPFPTIFYFFVFRFLCLVLTFCFYVVYFSLWTCESTNIHQQCINTFCIERCTKNLMQKFANSLTISSSFLGTLLLSFSVLSSAFTPHLSPGLLQLPALSPHSPTDNIRLCREAFSSQTPEFTS